MVFGFGVSIFVAVAARIKVDEIIISSIIISLSSFPKQCLHYGVLMLRAKEFVAGPRRRTWNAHHFSAAI